ncbi:MAG TPA: glycosyltransferase family 9 protein [Nitrospiraceae bacterium]|nr:glycosyltransferase family 9 protein [Nitrospiraceae bacterium]
MTAPTLKVSHARKIAILRANGLGDLIFALPAVQALRLAYPDAEMVWLGLDLHRQFFSHRPGPVDRVIVVPPSQGVRDDCEGADDTALQRFFEAMVEERFDVAVQIHGGGRFSNPFVRKLGARMTVGLRTPDAVALDRWIPYSYFQHEVLRYLEVVALLGTTAADLEPTVCVTEQDRSEIEALLPYSDQPLVAIHPGAGDPRRRWPAEKFAEVGDALQKAGAKVVVIGTKPERQTVDGVGSAMMTTPINLADRLSLGGLIGLLSRCCLVIGNDSGPLHLARTVGAGTVAIYWCGNFINAGPITRARHRAAISWRLTCPVCGVHCLEAQCHHSMPFVADVPVTDVLAPALELIQPIFASSEQ